MQIKTCFVSTNSGEKAFSWKSVEQKKMCGYLPDLHLHCAEQSCKVNHKHSGHYSPTSVCIDVLSYCLAFEWFNTLPSQGPFALRFLLSCQVSQYSAVDAPPPVSLPGGCVAPCLFTLAASSGASLVVQRASALPQSAWRRDEETWRIQKKILQGEEEEEEGPQKMKKTHWFNERLWWRRNVTNERDHMSAFRRGAHYKSDKLLSWCNLVPKWGRWCLWLYFWRWIYLRWWLVTITDLWSGITVSVQKSVHPLGLLLHDEQKTNLSHFEGSTSFYH